MGYKDASMCAELCGMPNGTQADDKGIDGRGIRRGARDRADRPLGRRARRESERGAARDGTLVVSLVLAGVRRPCFGDIVRLEVPAPGPARTRFRARLRI